MYGFGIQGDRNGQEVGPPGGWNDMHQSHGGREAQRRLLNTKIILCGRAKDGKDKHPDSEGHWVPGKGT